MFDYRRSFLGCVFHLRRNLQRKLGFKTIQILLLISIDYLFNFNYKIDDKIKYRDKNNPGTKINVGSRQKGIWNIHKKRNIIKAIYTHIDSEYEHNGLPLSVLPRSQEDQKRKLPKVYRYAVGKTIRLSAM